MEKKDSRAIVALVLGVASLVCGWRWVLFFLFDVGPDSFIIEVFAIPFSISSLIVKHRVQNRGKMTVWATICAILGLVGPLLIFVTSILGVLFWLGEW